MNKISIAAWDDLEDRKPAHALIADVDLVIVRFDERVSVANMEQGTRIMIDLLERFATR